MPASNSPITRFVTAALGILLVVVVAFQFMPAGRSQVIPRSEPLVDWLPPHVAGWQVEDLPLAATEVDKGTVADVLRFDEVVQRSYRRGDDIFIVYAAYWRPGKMPPREVAFHIPDKCWVAAGWTRLKVINGYSWPSGNPGMKPGQYRIFSHRAGGAPLHVLYWQVYKGETISYNPDGSPSDWSVIADLATKGLDQRGEQYFIRLSSSVPLERLAHEPGLAPVFERIADLGLRQ